MLFSSRYIPIIFVTLSSDQVLDSWSWHVHRYPRGIGRNRWDHNPGTISPEIGFCARHTKRVNNGCGRDSLANPRWKEELHRGGPGYLARLLIVWRRSVRQIGLLAGIGLTGIGLTGIRLRGIRLRRIRLRRIGLTGIGLIGIGGNRIRRNGRGDSDFGEAFPPETAKSTQASAQANGK